MIESADSLCQKHFGKSLIDKGVEILDPAAGTGTFISELIEHFRGQPQKLRYKYLEELHANEVAILPYYVANLNIEATYAAINGFEEYPNLCFVDTLDNTAALKTQKNQHVGDLFGGVSAENVARIKRQNKKKISVIIGNPPYNANQLNENENNKNREYLEIDRRIRESFIVASAAHKTKLYDMYARFFRWAADRIDENGIIAFVTNRSFIESRTFDGFRKIVAEEFNDIYIVDLGGDVRTDPRLSGTKHNVFGIQTGVAISFMIKRSKGERRRIRYACRPQLETAEEKLAFLDNARWDSITFDDVSASARHDWITQADNDFADLLPIAASKLSGKATSIQADPAFHEVSFGTVSNRDDWVYDFDRSRLIGKIEFYLQVYTETVRTLPRPLSKDWEKLLDYRIKWTQNLRRFAASSVEIAPAPEAISVSLYRPFCKKFFYYDEHLNWSLYRMRRYYPTGESSNVTIFFSDRGARSPFSVLATNVPAELHLCASTDGFQAIARYQYRKDGTRQDSLSDSALQTFRSHYAVGESRGAKQITKDAIFHYVYAVLYDPIYRDKYAQNLKRDFPRIPFYADFWRWAGWGEKLMALHVSYETVEPWPLERIDAPDEKSRKAGIAPKAMLKADKDTGNVRLDSETQLTGVPPEAWTYRLGNRSALEWILDQYKEKTPKDPTIREKFNTYRFADHKEKVIDLLMRVTRVSVETVAIVEAMKEEKR
jgi:predicted helicase